MAQTQTAPQTHTAHSATSNVPGRGIANSGVHHYVMDYTIEQEGPGEMPGPTDYFLSAISSCGVMMTEKEARHRGIQVKKVDATIEAFRHTEPKDSPHTTFARIEMRFTFIGATDAEAEGLVAFYQRNCPLYGSVAEAGTQMDVSFTTRPA